MLDYNLCLKLKEAGFPIVEEDHFFVGNPSGGFQCDRCGKWDTRPNVPATCLIEPTLSELISECGGAFEGLYRGTLEDTSKDIVELEWVAVGRMIELMGTGGAPIVTGMPEYRQQGKTPSEAVANLYLALNDSQESNPTK